MLDSSKLSSQKVPLFSREGRRAINVCTQVSGKGFLNEPRSDDLFWLNIRELYPVSSEVMSYPKHRDISTFASFLLNRVPWRLLRLVEFTLSYEVIDL